ncbi:hypothetical protein DL768_009734 [Monosporascus sp. mg162]|nr:hypothetical protein DL768_009734 [Monosporascus sp. mg162]
MWLVGFGFVPFFIAPLSESWGRNPIYYTTFLLFCLANIGCALSPDIAAFLVFRFVAGFFGSPSVPNSGGSIADLWSQSHRSVPLAIFRVACFCGPALAPIIGGFLTQYTSWRWGFWLVVIISSIIYAVIVLTLAETYAPSISGLWFLGTGIGMALAAALSPQVDRLHSHFVRKLGPLPEARLPHLIGIAWLLPVRPFWFWWTALPPTHWGVSMIGCVPFEFGLVMVFLGINSYLTDCHDRFSASALAANTMLRPLFGAGFALFSNDLDQKLGAPWATSLLGFVAVAMAVLPFIFFKYGSRLRAFERRIFCHKMAPPPTSHPINAPPHKRVARRSTY